MGFSIGGLASVDWGLTAKIGAQVGTVTSLDLGVIGGEIGKNGIRVSCPFGSLRLLGSE